jgi:hypothetical protein
MVALVGMARPPLAAASVLPRMKVPQPPPHQRRVELPLGDFWLFAIELMNQGATRHAVLECQDDVVGGHTRKLMALL